MDNDKQIQQRYMNTPYAYTMAQKGLTLLQQNIMVRVAAHLQPYLDRFFKNPELLNSTDDPKPLMTLEEQQAFPPVRVDLSELGVSSSSYSRVREALKEVLDAKIEINWHDETGKPTKRLINVFSKIDTPVTDKGTTVRMKKDDNTDVLTDVEVDRTRGYLEIHLNKDFLQDIFNMKMGYVSHPENIARIGRVDNMPLMYYLIRHKMLNFKINKAQITLDEIRDYLGMQTKDIEGNVTKVKYPKYSQFKSRIITTALNDIKRVCDEGNIDFYFDMHEIRPRGKKTGDPSYIEFTKVARKKAEKSLPEGEDKGGASWLDQFGNPTRKIGQLAWQRMCADCTTEDARRTFYTLAVDKIENKRIYLAGSDEQIQAVENLIISTGAQGKQWLLQRLTQYAQIEIKGIVYRVVKER